MHTYTHTNIHIHTYKYTDTQIHTSTQLDTFKYLPCANKDLLINIPLGFCGSWRFRTFSDETS